VSGTVTLVLGASPDPGRYSNLAVRRLVQHGHPVISVGRRSGSIGEVPIRYHLPSGTAIHTVTLYLNAANQRELEDGILALEPRRIIFNPGAENPRFARRAAGLGIDVIDACTLVMLATGRY
jgi:hypothetical protein